VENLDQIIDAFEVPPIHVLDWVFDHPRLRRALIIRAKDLIVKHEYAQLGNRERNAKLSPGERSILAKHAAAVRWHKGQSLPDHLDLLSSLFKINGNGSSVNGAGAPE
jgi:hypothetical protein